MKTKSYLPIFSLLFGAFVWGIIWYPYRLMALAGVAGIYSSLYIFTLTLAIALPYFFITKNCFFHISLKIYFIFIHYISHFDLKRT